MPISRRDFIVTSAAAAGGLLISRTSLGQVATTAPGEMTDFAPPGEFKVKYYGEFSELPFGSVQPRGWIQGWLERQAKGLTGHPENLAYPYDTCMFAGKVAPPPVKHGELWWPYEQSGYFVDSAVRLALLVEDPAAQVLPAANIRYILTHSGPTHLGESTWGWPNTVVGRALMAEYSGTGNTAAAQVLMNYLLGSKIGPSRDGFVAEQAFYLYGLTGDTRLLDIARRCYNRFFITEPKSFSNEAKIKGTAPLKEHGVTAAEQLKLAPLMYSYTGDKEALELAKLAYEKVLAVSLMPDGGIVSSESIGPAVFNSLHETCDITDWSWSFGYMLMASGEGRFGDLIERATFNALPGVVTKDFKQVQYFSSANQVLATSTACPRIAMTRMSYRAGHETACCSGNVSRAMPNYVSRMWMRSETGLAAALYGPCEVHSKVNGQPISIVEETDYPFRDTVKFTVKLEKPTTFSLSLRIPQWCAAAAVVVNDQEIHGDAAAGTFAAVKREFHDGDVVMLRLPMTAAVQEWFGGKAATIHRGPLVYSLKVAEKRVEIQHDTDAIRRVLIGHNIEGFPAVEFYPESEWRFGMDAAMKNTPEKIQIKESPMTGNPFLAESIPVQLLVPVRQLSQWAADWKPVLDPPPADLKQNPKNPSNLPLAAELQSPGAVQMIEFVPYGSTHLRLTSLPMIGAAEPA
jgi:hypothetical protein